MGPFKFTFALLLVSLVVRYSNADSSPRPAWIEALMASDLPNITKPQFTCEKQKSIVAKIDQEIELSPCIKIDQITIGKVKSEVLNLSDSELSKVQFEKVSLHSGVFQNSLFNLSHLKNFNVSRSDFSRSQWRGGSVNNCHLDSGSWREAKVWGTRIRNTSLKRAFMQNSFWQNCYFEKVDLQEADLRNAKFIGCTFVGVNFENAKFNNQTILPFTSIEKSALKMRFEP